MDQSPKNTWGGLLGPRLPGQELARASSFVPLRLTLLPTGLHVDLLKPDQVVGRHSQCEVRLPLSDVSRRHCRFVFADGHWQVTDLASTNGTFVNEIPVQQAILKPGDHLRIGSFTFEVQYLPAGAPVSKPELPGVRFPDQHRTQTEVPRGQRKAS